MLLKDHFNFIWFHHILELSSHHSYIRRVIIDIVVDRWGRNENRRDMKLINGFYDGFDKWVLWTAKVWVEVHDEVIKTS